MLNLIPKPTSLTYLSGEFTLTDRTSIQVDDNTASIGEHLSEQIEFHTKLKLHVVQQIQDRDFIQLGLTNNQTLGEEGYTLSITPAAIQIQASQPAGLFYGIQSLRQMLTTAYPTFCLPAVSIIDSPRFRWRGAMLDVARHFFDVQDVMRFIDLIAHYKINRLHLHLTDDQGWRIEIKAWPQLTEIGGHTQVGGGGGGFYTQEQFKEIVEYARSRFVMIIPEIDTPGHTNAALASYPQLNQSEEAKQLYEGTEVGFSSLNIHSEITYRFLDDVIREVGEISPAPYIHIGGDETHATSKEDFKFFIKKLQEIVYAHNKIAIGWAEIGEVELNPQTIAQHWQGTAYQGAKAQGNKFIISPGNKTYLDMKYDASTPVGLDWAGLISVKDSYDWNPGNYMEGLEENDIIGLEAPLWTETILTIKDIEYMVFPRLPGLAELAWSSNAEGWDAYKLRLAKHANHMQVLNINFYKSPDVAWE